MNQNAVEPEADYEIITPYTISLENQNKELRAQLVVSKFC